MSVLYWSQTAAGYEGHYWHGPPAYWIVRYNGMCHLWYQFIKVCSAQSVEGLMDIAEKHASGKYCFWFQRG